jgi:uncharacterized membrane protein YtjA (UPF0391 family)
MLKYGIIFLVLALVAAVLGYGEVANFSYEGAQVIFVLFLVLAIAFLATGALGKRLFAEERVPARRR